MTDPILFTDHVTCSVYFTISGYIAKVRYMLYRDIRYIKIFFKYYEIGSI